MANNKLSLIVSFTGQDKLSGGIKNIIAVSKSGTAQFSKTVAEIKALKSQMATTGAFRKAVSDFRASQQAAARARAELARLKGEIVQGAPPTARLVKQIQRAEKSMLKLEAAEKAAGSKFKALSSDLKAAGADVGRLAQHEKKLADALANTSKKLEAQKRNFERRSKWTGRLDEASSNLRSAGTATSLAVSTPLVALGVRSVQASRESAAALAQVNASLASMGPVAGRSLEQLQDQATNLMKTSLFDDDDIMRNVTASMLTFGNVTGSVFDRAQQAAVDMSAKFGTDLQSSSIMLGKALNDPVKGVNALSRAGVSFTGTQKAMIKSLTDSGKLTDAQNIILSEMQKQFGGAGKAARDADPGGALALQAGEFEEVVGAKLMPTVMKVMGEAGKLADAFGNLSPGMQSTIVTIGLAAVVAGPLLLALGGIASGIGMVVAAAPALATVFAVITSPIGLTIAAFALLAYAIYSNWGTIKAAFATGWQWVKDTLSAAPGWLANLGSMMMSGLLSMIDPFALRNRLLEVAQNGIVAFKNFFGIKSPSRVFMAMGGHMTSGLAMGIDRGSRTPLLAMGRMAGAVAGAGALSLAAPSFAAAPAISVPPLVSAPMIAGPSLASTGVVARAGGGGVTIGSINITQQPGEDADALADRVIRRIRQEQARARRSTYEDY